MGDSLFLAAPEGTTWPLGLDTVEVKLRERFPGIAAQRLVGGASGREILSFDVEIGGAMRHGTYVEGEAGLCLSDATPAEWADLMEWFLGLLPPGTGLVVMAERDPRLVTLVSDVDIQELVALLDELAQGR